ncbi:MAG: ATP-binding protein [Desulfobacteraceae bacterium]|nr:ATP-binding protein [Desulfobacteraceae bacterium]
MKTSLYKNLQRKLIAITLVVSFAPFIILGATIYYQFARMYRDKIEEQIKYRASAQAETVDLFLKERTAILSAMADTNRLHDIVDENKLSHIFKVMNLRAGAFIDLGVIDSAGQHLAYVGPYDLKGLNYYQQSWFGEVMSRGIYISDVYVGYRKLPHFIIAVRCQENNQSWILRATIDPNVFEGIVRSAMMGKTGDAYIINNGGVFQTAPRFGGQILSESKLDTTLFGGRTTVIEQENGHHRKLLYAGSWLNNNKWLLIISQEASEEMSGLFATQQLEVVIIIAGIMAILLATIFTTRLTVNRLREADSKMDELNAQLIQSDKLAALGKMAASVAHEINNPLATIMQKTGWIQDLLAEEEFQKTKNLEEYYASLAVIDEQAEHAGRVVHNMLGYARRMEPRLENVDINEAINQTIDILENYARINNIDIQTDLASDLPIIAGDQSQLQQVVLNLISNAIDAIETEGLVEVTSQRTDSYIDIRITDNGPGIPEDKQKKVFEPFFSTKLNGKGTGLGLWLSYNIVEKMGGVISLKSEGKSTTFTIRLPIVIPEKK